MSKQKIEREHCPACDGVGLRPVEGDPGAYHFCDDAECPWCDGDGTLPAGLVALLNESAERFAAVTKERDDLLAFKTYVHKRLDEAGVPHEVPESEHTKAGCRVGGRLDYLCDCLLIPPVG